MLGDADGDGLCDDVDPCDDTAGDYCVVITVTLDDYAVDGTGAFDDLIGHELTFGFTTGPALFLDSKETCESVVAQPSVLFTWSGQILVFRAFSPDTAANDYLQSEFIFEFENELLRWAMNLILEPGPDTDFRFNLETLEAGHRLRLDDEDHTPACDSRNLRQPYSGATGRVMFETFDNAAMIVDLATGAGATWEIIAFP